MKIVTPVIREGSQKQLPAVRAKQSRTLPPLLSLLLLLVLPALSHGETAVQAWVQHYGGPGNVAGNLTDQAVAVVVDGSSNVIVTGGSMGIGEVTIQYSSSGVPLWTNSFSGASPKAVAVDGSNSVIVAGNVGSSSSSYATIACSSAGVSLWTNYYGGRVTGIHQAYAVAVDGSNNVIVTGRSANNAISSDYATIKYSSAGLPLWTNRYHGPVHPGGTTMTGPTHWRWTAVTT